MNRYFGWLIAAIGTLACGCATLKGLVQDSLVPSYEGAVVMDNPISSGKVPRTVNADISHEERSTVMMHSVAPGRVCFMITTPNPDAPRQLALRVYKSLQELQDKTKYGNGGELPTKINTVSTGKQTEFYETTQTTQIRGSRGQTIASTETPVTKSTEYKVFTMESCYPGKGFTKQTKFLGLEYTGMTTLGQQTRVVAAWRFN